MLGKARFSQSVLIAVAGLFLSLGLAAAKSHPTVIRLPLTHAMTDISFDASVTTAATSSHPRVIVVKAWNGGASPSAHFDIQFFFPDKKDPALLTRIPILESGERDVTPKIWGMGECPLAFAAVFETNTPPRTIFLATAERFLRGGVMGVPRGEAVKESFAFFRLDVNEDECDPL